MKQTIYIIIFLFVVFLFYVNNRKKLKSQNISATNNKHTDRTIFPRAEKQLEKDSVFDEDYQYPEYNDKKNNARVKPFSVKTDLSINQAYKAGGMNIDKWNTLNYHPSTETTNSGLPPAGPGTVYE